MVKYADGPTAEVEIEVNVAPSDLWPLVTDIELPARFSEELQGAEWLEGAGPVLGGRFRGTNRHPKVGEWSTVCTVVELDPERVFGWAVQDTDNPAAMWRFELEPAGERTRLRLSARMGPGPSGLTGVIEAHPDLEDEIVEHRLGEWRSNMTATLEGLKSLAESG